MPGAVAGVLAERCFDCHDELSEKGGINLDLAEIDWSDGDQIRLWHKAYNAVAHAQMPPMDEPQPTAEESETLLAWLDEQLTRHAPVGGTLPRRLNRLEYRNSIRTVFRMPGFELPDGFPPDQLDHGFDTVSEALVLSPPLLEAYQNTAADIADLLFPPERPKPPVQKLTATPEDLVLSFSASTLHEDGAVLRLAAKSNSIMRSSTWPTKIEIGTSAVYRITVEASAFRPREGQTMTLEVRARDLEASDRSPATSFRQLAELEIEGEKQQTFTFEAELYEGQTPLFRWTDSGLDHNPEVFAPMLEKRFEAEPRFHAAWLRMIFPDEKRRRSLSSLRGRNGWEILQRNLENPDLDVQAVLAEERYVDANRKAIRQVANVRNLGDTYAYEHHEKGPALEIRGVTVEGPFRRVDGPRDEQSRSWREWQFGKRTQDDTDESYAERGLRRFLPRLFRRPVDEETVQAYLAMAKEHWEKGHRFEDGMHLLLRNALVSPRFLYRETKPGPLDDHDLASRLAYFLTRHPPTADIVFHARAGRLLGNPEVYRSEAERLLPSSPGAPMIRDFTSQWLNTRILHGIMPDEVFDFSPEDVDIAKGEVERFFSAMLEENRPLSDFIDPDFLISTREFAKEHYDYEAPEGKASSIDKSQKGFQRLPLERGGRRGGLLGMSAVMMATANGVDTQPVLRGVWVVENLLGTPLPPVPDNVPALTPDTRGATTPRELIAAHTEAADCRGCHRHIDPVGFALENFDPVGGWRDQWPGTDADIDASSTLPDGTEIEDFTDFKRWLANHPRLFGQCLAEKLMIYATGRVPSYAESVEIESIVDDVLEKKGGFRDLLLALVESETFRTR